MRLKISRLSVLPVISVLTIALAGCGGSSNSSQVANNGSRTQITNTPTTPTNPAPVTTTLRTYTDGDSWTYKVTGTLKTSSGTTTLTNGTMTVFVQNFAEPVDYTYNSVTGIAHMSFSYSYCLPWSSGTTEVRNYMEIFSQDSSQNVLRAADTLTDTPFAKAGSIQYAHVIVSADQSSTTQSAQPVTPGSWSATAGISSYSDYDVLSNTSGKWSATMSNTERVALSVTKQEAVSVPLGSYTCWKANQIYTYQLTNQKTVNATYWWAPLLGQPVMMDTVEENSDGSGTRTLHYEMISTTVPGAGIAP